MLLAVNVAGFRDLKGLSSQESNNHNNENNPSEGISTATIAENVMVCISTSKIENKNRVGGGLC